jgi:hypothetical protein
MGMSSTFGAAYIPPISNWNAAGGEGADLGDLRLGVTPDCAWS